MLTLAVSGLVVLHILVVLALLIHVPFDVPQHFHPDVFQTSFSAKISLRDVGKTLRGKHWAG